MLAPIRRAAPVTRTTLPLDFDELLTDTKTMQIEESRVILPQPPDELKQLSEQLRQRIVSRIESEGPMSFSRYMEMALYEPGLGYYSAGLRKFGEDGDFITSPELGSIFARCLATQVRQISDELGDYCIFEIGAGTGRLASDLLAELSKTSLPSKYMILERSADLRQLQGDTLQAEHPDLIGRIEWLDEPPTEPWRGILIANEVIDALAVERFRISSGSVQEMQVGLVNCQLAWQAAPARDALADAVTRAQGGDLDAISDDYTSELSLLLTPWLKGLCEAMVRGCALFIDYGYPRSEYYSAQRHMGTLVCHYRHRAHDDPFLNPGLQDISAFVDFTALAEAGDACALECSGYTSQAMFLLGCGLENMAPGLEQMTDRERIQQASEIRQLTLPGAMGEKFQAMALTRELDLDLVGFWLLDLRHRL